MSLHKHADTRSADIKGDPNLEMVQPINPCLLALVLDCYAANRCLSDDESQRQKAVLYKPAVHYMAV